MDSSPSEPYEIFSPTDDRRFQAISTVFGGSHQRTARYTQRSADSGGELIFAICGENGSISNAVLLSRSPGRTAMLFVTQPHSKEDQERGVALIQHAISRAARINAVLIQALIEPLRDDELAMFSRGGMNPIGTLAYMELTRVQPSSSDRERAPLGATIRSWDSSKRDELEALLESTYIDSLDCPGLSKLRQTSDILDGHIHTGIVDPDTWLILELNGVPCGVSLISEIPASKCLELVSFGLSPQARGQRLGAHLLDYALRVVQNRNRPIALACDERNQPALRLYQSRGFSIRLRRVALVAPAQPLRDCTHTPTSAERPPLPTTYPRPVDK